MTAITAQFDDRAHSGAWRFAVTWVVLLAFALQAYITQTHIHPSPVASGRAPAVGIAKTVVHAAAPKDGNRAIDCPLCQAMAAAGAFIAPGLSQAPPPTARFLQAAVTVGHAGFPAAPAGFAWRSRAPPQA